ncbi:MAG: helix-turn-helix domain-containing protein [Thermodesulfobacteriota bacterium]|nr:helix-turn-helix domain-containing protein [Thermodesulfobacteriota bacterium]
MSDLAKKVRKDRKSSGFSQKYLAGILNISTATLQRIESGAVSPSINLLYEIAKALGKPITSYVEHLDRKTIHLKKKEQETSETDSISLKIAAPFGMIAENIAIGFGETIEGKVLEIHRENKYEWAYILKGEFSFEQSGKSHIIEEGDAFFYNGTIPYKIKAKKDSQFILIFIK